jgi:hypothetical protein
MLAAAPLQAADQEFVKTNWSGFVEQVAARKPEVRKVRVTLFGGQTVETRLIRATTAGLVVPGSRSTKQWTTGNNEALIPSQQGPGVRCEGRVSHKRLIRTLAGA